LLGIEFDLFVLQKGAEASSSLATRFLGAQNSSSTQET
jgi:hypothetical protein